MSILKDSVTPIESILDNMDLRYHYEPDTGNYVYQASISVMGEE